jgi:hypothetical protein
MMTIRTRLRRLVAACTIIALPLIACTQYPAFLVGPDGIGMNGGNVAGANFFVGTPFVAELIQARTFTDGTAVKTVTYDAADMSRTPLGIDFDGDGKVDPVVGYGRDQAVVQILMSNGPIGVASYVSLTLDSNLDMRGIADVAVADMDHDGNLDILAGAETAIWYLHHPSDTPTTDLRAWNLETIGASENDITNDDLEQIISQSAGIGVNLENYTVTVEQKYAAVDVGDFDNDGAMDVAASRSFKVFLAPKPDSGATPISIVDGDVIVYGNPGNSADGVGWSATSVGIHERIVGLDRDGASDLMIYDMDDDGDLDIVSAATEDNNVQVAWFENPGGPLDGTGEWTQWRIGSVRDARALDLADLTGDGQVDVIATGGAQQQLVLFEHPFDGPKRAFDWDTYPIVTFDTYEPRDVVVLDINGDGRSEIALGGTNGAVRYFSPNSNPRDEWNAYVVHTFDPPGDVGYLGYADVDGDGDVDLLVVVADASEPNASQISWIRNDAAIGN